MTMVKNMGRRKPGQVGESGYETDATWGEYKAALPGTLSEIAMKLGISVRKAERSLGILRNFGLVQRDGDKWHGVAD